MMVNNSNCLLRSTKKNTVTLIKAFLLRNRFREFYDVHRESIAMLS